MANRKYHNSAAAESTVVFRGWAPLRPELTVALCAAAMLLSASACRGPQEKPTSSEAAVEKAPGQPGAPAEAAAKEKADAVSADLDDDSTSAGQPSPAAEHKDKAHDSPDDDPEEGDEGETPEAERRPAANPDKDDPYASLFRMLRDTAEGHVNWARGLLASERELKDEVERLKGLLSDPATRALVGDQELYDEVKAEWESLAKELGLELASFTASKATLDVIQLPDSMPADRPLELTNNHVRATHQLIVRLPVMDREKLTALLEGIKKFKRLTLVRRIKPERGENHLVNAEFYQFLPTDKPAMLVPERTVEAEMAQLGIRLTLQDAVRRDPVGYVQTAALALAEYRAARNRLQEVVELKRQLLWLQLQHAFIAERLNAREAMKLDDFPQALQ